MKWIIMVGGLIGLAVFFVAGISMLFSPERHRILLARLSSLHKWSAELGEPLPRSFIIEYRLAGGVIAGISLWIMWKMVLAIRYDFVLAPQVEKTTPGQPSWISLLLHIIILSFGAFSFFKPETLQRWIRDRVFPDRVLQDRDLRRNIQTLSLLLIAAGIYFIVVWLRKFPW